MELKVLRTERNYMTGYDMQSIMERDRSAYPSYSGYY